MDPRFTRGEYWLLETVVERELSVCELIRSDLELLLNKKGHGLSRASLVETLYRLLDSGLIYARVEPLHQHLSSELTCAKEETSVFISTGEEIERALDELKSWRSVPETEQKITAQYLRSRPTASDL